MQLNQINAPRGLDRRRKRVGRGVGSGRGKTCGRGSKGQTSRSGRKPRFGFEGGQMPIIRRMPKRGFRQRNPNIYQIINLDKLNKLKKDSVVNAALLAAEGLVKRKSLPVKVLAKGELKKPLTLQVEKLSAAAMKKVKAAGGKVLPLTKKARQKDD